MNEKLKSKVLNKMLINEHCNIISNYLGCDTCIKMKPILDDPIYQTLNPEQQQIYKVIKLLPFPDDIDELKDTLDNYTYEFKTVFAKTTEEIDTLEIEQFLEYLSEKGKKEREEEQLRDLKKSIDNKAFTIIKKYYQNMYIDNFNRECFLEERIILEDGLRDKGIQWCSIKIILGIINYSLKAKFKDDTYLDCFKICNLKSSEDLDCFNFSLWERAQF